MLFSDSWFRRHQHRLLWWVNHPAVRWVVRARILRMPVLALTSRVLSVEPHAYTLARKNGQRDYIVHTHAKYAKRLRHALAPVWRLAHWWDAATWRVAPAWNVGFDTLDVYPDAHTETYTVDGEVHRSGVSESWATIKAGAGSSANTATATGDWVGLNSTSTRSVFAILTRGFCLFKTDGLGSGATISSATLYLYHTSYTTGLGDTSVQLVSSAPASNTDLVAADFTTCGSTSFGSFAAITGLTLSVYNALSLNATGLAAISKTGITKFGLLLGWELSGTPGTGKNTSTSAGFAFADNTGSSTDPYLHIVYTPGGIPPLSVAGSMASAGALTKALSRTFTGAVGPTGVAVKRFGTAKGGSITTLVGTLAKTKVTLKSVAGAVSTLTGAITQRPAKSLGGAVSSLTGAVVKRVSFTKAGAMTSLVGAVSKQTGRGFAGAASSVVGVLAKRPGKALSGAVSSIVGAVGRYLSGFRAFAGSVASVGDYEGHKAMQTKSVAGGIAGTGALASTKVVLKSLAGAASSGGALVRLIVRPVAGGLASAGAVLKRPGKALDGAASSTGALTGTRAFLRSLAGGIALSGTLLTRVAGRVFSGTAALAGVVVKRAGKAFAGSVSSSGTLTSLKVFLKTLTGAIASTGARVAHLAGTVFAGGIPSAGVVSRRAGKAFAGAASSAGALSRQMSLLRSWAGGIASSGALTKTKVILASLAGSAASVGALVRRTNITRTGAIASDGTLTKRPTQSRAGSVASAGTLARQRSVSKAIAGTVATAGAIVRRVNKGLAGALVSAGLFSRNTLAMSLDGAVVLSGTLARARQITLAGALSWVGSLVTRWLGHNPEYTRVINVTLTGSTAIAVTMTGSTAIGAAVTGPMATDVGIAGPTAIDITITGPTAIDVSIHP